MLPGRQVKVTPELPVEEGVDSGHLFRQKEPAEPGPEVQGLLYQWQSEEPSSPHQPPQPHLPEGLHQVGVGLQAQGLYPGRELQVEVEDQGHVEQQRSRYKVKKLLKGCSKLCQLIKPCYL